MPTERNARRTLRPSGLRLRGIEAGGAWLLAQKELKSYLE